MCTRMKCSRKLKFVCRLRDSMRRSPLPWPARTGLRGAYLVGHHGFSTLTLVPGISADPVRAGAVRSATEVSPTSQTAGWCPQSNQWTSLKIHACVCGARLNRRPLVIRSPSGRRCRGTSRCTEPADAAEIADALQHRSKNAKIRPADARNHKQMSRALKM